MAFIVAMVFTLPTFWMVTSSFRPESEIFSSLSPLSIFSVIPKIFSLESFTQLFGAREFTRPLLNSLFIAIATTFLGLLFCAPAAFALAVMRFPARNAIFVLLFISFSVPFDLVAVPLSSLVRNWGLADTYFALIVPGLGNGFAILLLRQFFLGIPPQLKEAARVDGAGWTRILFEIYLPLARPALVAAGVTIFISQWQAYLWPLLVSSRTDMQVGSVALAAMQSGSLIVTSFGVIFAGATVLAIVPALVMLVFQRTFTASIASGGSTG
jgi:multiple sugar transport system permease protein/putative chitobiose transport system permease protein